MLITKLIPQRMKLLVVWTNHVMGESKFNQNLYFGVVKMSSHLLMEHSIQNLLDGEKLPLVGGIP